MITIQKCNLNVVVQGEGDGIVLLHGWGQNQYMMKFIQDALCSKYKVINIDLPGFGKSSEPPCIWNIQAYADMIHEVLVYYHVEKVSIIAHSFGARIALRYALTYRVDKMILSGAAGIKAKRGFSYYTRVMIYKGCKKCHINVNMGSEDYQKASPIMRGVFVASVQDDIRSELKNIPCEVLLVWGEYDKQTPLWMGKIMEREIPKATLIVLPKEDHFAYFHCSLQFKGIVEAFLYG
ncbi:MAG: alpha/beta hydrolase [Longicatena sp.]